MARKIEIKEYRDWQDVDNALRRMGEIDIKLGDLEGKMTLKINEIREEFDTKAEGLKAERKKLEAEITAFVEIRKDEFLKTRSRELTFGVVAYRLVTKVVIRSKAACIAALKALNLAAYIRYTEEPDKEALSGLDVGTLAKVGASLKTEDKLRIEPKLEKIADYLKREAA